MIFKKKNNKVEKIYQNIVKISRSKFFYLELDLEDNFETRFDLIVFHAFMIFYFYKKKKIDKTDISQNLFDYMFNDFENNLREMGFGDIAVNKKMKFFIRAFYGRIAKYSESIDLQKIKQDNSLLESTILNNIYKGKIRDKNNVKWFADYIIKNIDIFINKSEKENLNMNFEFIGMK